MRKIVLDTNCLLMSLPRISPYRKIWDDFLKGKLTLCVINRSFLYRLTSLISSLISSSVSSGVSPLSALALSSLNVAFAVTSSSLNICAISL